uniref:Uncharacterized protein n=1 Tax=Opuntia streptacantha TaxID=393608 RepID=A0A7C8YLM4_OPUST
MICINEVPLPSALVITPIIAISWEVNPFGMAKLITHEVKIAISSQGHCDKMDHLVKGNPSLNYRRSFCEAGHSSVHFLVHKQKGYSFVAYNGLIMTFSISYALLSVSSICQGTHDFVHRPFFILLILQIVNPLVRNSHRKAIVKANPPFRD